MRNLYVMYVVMFTKAMLLLKNVQSAEHLQRNLLSSQEK